MPPIHAVGVGMRMSLLGGSAAGAVAGAKGFGDTCLGVGRQLKPEGSSGAVSLRDQNAAQDPVADHVGGDLVVRRQARYGVAASLVLVRGGLPASIVSNGSAAADAVAMTKVANGRLV